MKKVLSILTLVFLTVACQDLDVENTNNPDEEKVLQTPEDLAALVDGSYLNFWNGLHKYSPYNTLLVAADVGSSSWGNFGMRDVGTVAEPYGLGDHKPIDNSLTYNYRVFYETPWQELYKGIGGVNKAIKKIVEDGVIIKIGDKDKTEETLAKAYFLRGICYGYLALLFDKAFIVTETSDLSALRIEDMQAYAEVLKQSISDIDLAIETVNTLNDFDLTAMNETHYNKDRFLKVCHSYIARFLMLYPRSTSEQVDWSKVLSNAQLGLDNFNFEAEGDGGIVWYHAWDTGMDATWTRVDQRIVNMADNNQPYPFPKGGYIVDLNNIPDKRFGTDPAQNPEFLYVPSVNFRADRGEYFFSYWKFNKYQSYIETYTGPMPTFTFLENKLIIAEALIRTGGDKIMAANLINETRVNLGSLSPLTGAESNDQMLNALMYERYLEAYEGPGNSFFDRRRTDDLGQKQFTQFPVPASELAIFQEPPYTFGGN